MTKAEYIKRYGEEAYEKYKAQIREYNRNHKEQRAQYNREYYEINKEQIAQQKKAYNNTPIGRANNLIGGYRASDHKYNRGECTLTTDYMVNVLYPFGCVYCGKMDWRELGADRIDNTKPHTPENVVCCCSECNKKKHTTDTYTYFINSPVWEKFGVLCE